MAARCQQERVLHLSLLLVSLRCSGLRSSVGPSGLPCVGVLLLSAAL